MTTPQTSVESPIRQVSNGLIPQRELNGSRECDLNTRIRWVVLASFQSAVARPVGRRLRSVGLHWGFIPVASCDACYFGAPKVGWNLWAFARALADARRTTVCFRFFRVWENSRGFKQSENFSPWYSKLCCSCRSHNKLRWPLFAACVFISSWKRVHSPSCSSRQLSGRSTMHAQEPPKLLGEPGAWCLCASLLPSRMEKSAMAFFYRFTHCKSVWHHGQFELDSRNWKSTTVGQIWVSCFGRGFSFKAGVS